MNLRNELNREYSIKMALYYSLPWMLLAFSVLIFIGWCIGVTDVAQIRPDWVTMKPVTALSFIVASLAMIFHVHQKPRSRDFLAGWFSLIAMGAVSAWYYHSEAINILPAFNDPLYFSLAQNVPSWATVALFLIFSLSFFRRNKKPWGWAMMLVSGTALIGYAADIPSLYFYIPDISTAMAFPTAVFFLHQGMWMLPNFRLK